MDFDVDKFLATPVSQLSGVKNEASQKPTETAFDPDAFLRKEIAPLDVHQKLDLATKALDDESLSPKDRSQAEFNFMDAYKERAMKTGTIERIGHALPSSKSIGKALQSVADVKLSDVDSAIDSVFKQYVNNPGAAALATSTGLGRGVVNAGLSLYNVSKNLTREAMQNVAKYGDSEGMAIGAAKDALDNYYLNKDIVKGKETVSKVLQTDKAPAFEQMGEIGGEVLATGGLTTLGATAKAAQKVAGATEALSAVKDGGRKSISKLLLDQTLPRLERSIGELQNSKATLFEELEKRRGLEYAKSEFPRRLSELEEQIDSRRKLATVIEGATKVSKWAEKAGVNLAAGAVIGTTLGGLSEVRPGEATREAATAGGLMGTAAGALPSVIEAVKPAASYAKVLNDRYGYRGIAPGETVDVKGIFKAVDDINNGRYEPSTQAQRTAAPLDETGITYQPEATGNVPAKAPTSKELFDLVSNLEQNIGPSKTSAPILLGSRTEFDVGAGVNPIQYKFKAAAPAGRGEQVLKAFEKTEKLTGRDPKDSVHAFGYDPEKRNLLVQMEPTVYDKTPTGRGIEQYLYTDVSPEQFNAFKSASVKSDFLNQEIWRSGDVGYLRVRSSPQDVMDAYIKYRNGDIVYQEGFGFRKATSEEALAAKQAPAPVSAPVTPAPTAAAKQPVKSTFSVKLDNLVDDAIAQNKKSFEEGARARISPLVESPSVDMLSETKSFVDDLRGIADRLDEQTTQSGLPIKETTQQQFDSVVDNLRKLDAQIRKEKVLSFKGDKNQAAHEAKIQELRAKFMRENANRINALKNPQQAARAADVEAALAEKERTIKSPQGAKALSEELVKEQKTAADIEEGIKGPSTAKETKEMQIADVKAQEQKTALRAADLKAALLEEEIGKKSPKAAKSLKAKLAEEQKFAQDVEEGVKGPSIAAEKQRMQEADIAAQSQKTAKRASDVEAALSAEERARQSPEEAKSLKGKLAEEQKTAAEVEEGIKGPSSLAEVGKMQSADVEARTQKTAKRASDVESALSEKEKELKSPQALQRLKDWYAELERRGNQPPEAPPTAPAPVTPPPEPPAAGPSVAAAPAPAEIPVVSNPEVTVTKTKNKITLKPSEKLDAEVSQLATKKQMAAQKNYLTQNLAELEKAAPEVPDKENSKVTLKVPGDGQYNIVNTKASLASFREKIESKFGTKLTVTKPAGKKIPKMTEAERAEWQEK